jgi:hypothetical protein
VEILIWVGFLIHSVALASDPHGPVVAAGDASQTLLEFSRRSSIQILYLSKDVEGVATQELDGTLKGRQALEAMLAITRLKVRFVDPRSAVVTPDNAPPTSARPTVSKRRTRKLRLPGTPEQVAGAATSSSNSTLGYEVNWRGLGATVPMPEFRHHESLPADRRTNRTSNLTIWGGANFDSPLGDPGTITIGNDRDTPFVPNPPGIEFDPTNAEPRSRVLMLKVIKQI